MLDRQAPVAAVAGVFDVHGTLESDVTEADHPLCRAVDGALASAGVPGRVRMLPEAAPTAARAAEQIGCPVGAIANSLVFADAGGRPVLIMASGAHRVDLAMIASATGLRLGRAGADFVRQHTSQPIGGVAPVGHPEPIQTLIDVDLAAYEELWAGGGIPHAVFPISYADLVRVTDGTVITVA